MSTTDTLREALLRASDDIAAINAAGFDSERLRLSNDAHKRIVTALAAVPAEPEAHYSGMNAQQLYDELNNVGAECSRLEADILDIHDALVSRGLDGAINAGSIIERIESLRPAEPEAWEWRAYVRVEDFVVQPDFASSVPYDTPERPARIVAEDRAEGREAWLERRRAPGPWERVDPKPRPQDGER